jgi:glycosyltransferase involved in cell wall biosynthesis
MAAAVVPCYNEAGSISAVVRGIGKYVPTIVVVDDGSSDATGVRALEAGALVLRHERNRGKGAALNTGLKAAWKKGFRWAVLLDGDGQHAPEDIPAFRVRAENTGADLVIGNRMQHAELMPWLRRAVNRWMSRELSRLAGTPLPDTQCGFRLMSLAAWRSLEFNTTHFEVESEMTLAFARAGHRVEFVPVQPAQCKRPSRIRPLVDTWRWLRWRLGRREFRALNELNGLKGLDGLRAVNEVNG